MVLIDSIVAAVATIATPAQLVSWWLIVIDVHASWILTGIVALVMVGLSLIVGIPWAVVGLVPRVATALGLVLVWTGHSLIALVCGRSIAVVFATRPVVLWNCQHHVHNSDEWG